MPAHHFYPGKHKKNNGALHHFQGSVCGSIPGVFAWMIIFLTQAEFRVCRSEKIQRTTPLAMGLMMDLDSPIRGAGKFPLKGSVFFP